MKQATKRFLSTLLSLFFLVGAFIMFFQFIQPLYSDVQQVRSELESRKNFLADQKDAIQKVQQLIATYQGQGELQQRVSLVIPTSTDTVGALAQLNGLAVNDRLRIESVSISSPILASPATVAVATGTPKVAGGESFTKPLGMVNIQLKLSGTYADFKDFVGKLETNMRIFDVKTINFAATNKPGVYSFDITVTVYYQSL